MTASKLFSLLAAGSLVTLAFAAIGCAAPSVDNAEGTGETESHLLGGTRLTPSDVATNLRAAGFPESAIGKMVCTAKYESSYYEKATNKNSNGSTDYGLFQINSVHLGDSSCPKSSASLFDPATNAKCALSVYKSQGINAWYGYQKHKTECDKTMAPAATGSTTTTSSSGSTTTTSSSGYTTSSSGSTATTSSSGSTGSTTTTTGDDDDDDTSTATIDPNSDYDLGGGCWSATMQDMMDPLSCVQSVTDNAWEQCKDGQWYRGTQVQGPYGYCNGTYVAGQSVSTSGDDDDTYTAH